MRQPAEPLEAYRAMSRKELIGLFRVGVERFDRRVFELNDEQLDRVFDPETGAGMWAVRVLLGHLADAEVINTHRLRKAFAEDGPVIDAWGPDEYIDSGLYGVVARDGEPVRQPIGGFVATIHTLRAWMGEWLEGLPPPAWDRRAMHTVRGEFTFRELLGLSTWHLENHAWFLNRKVELILGSASG